MSSDDSDFFEEAKRLLVAKFAPAGSDTWTPEQWSEYDARLVDDRTPRDASPSGPSHAARGLSLRAMGVLAASKVDTPSMAILRQWHIDHPREGIGILSGPNGIGKTVAATWWAMETNAVVIRAPVFAATSRYDREAHTRWTSARCVVLSDLGAEFSDSKGSLMSDLENFIDEHYEGMHRLVVTTNCTSKDFQDKYGKRMLDRLSECGTWMSVTGDSMRKRKPRAQ